jgi:hypothetical protein
MKKKEKIPISKWDITCRPKYQGGGIEVIGLKNAYSTNGYLRCKQNECGKICYIIKIFGIARWPKLRLNRQTHPVGKGS